MQKFEPSKILLAGGSTPMDFYANYLNDKGKSLKAKKVIEDALKKNPRNFEKNNIINVAMIEIAKNLYPSLCIFGNIVLNIINSLIIFS